MTSIKQLIDKDGNPIFPVTHTNAIFDSEGNKIEDRLSNIVNKTKNTKHITENGVKEFSCKNGYADNIAIKGKTLVNLSSYDKGIRALTEASGNIWSISDDERGNYSEQNGIITYNTGNTKWCDFGSIIPVTEGSKIRFIADIIENNNTGVNCIAMFFNDKPILNQLNANTNKIVGTIVKKEIIIALGIQDNQFEVPVGSKYALFVLSFETANTTYKFRYMLLENNEDDFISYFEGLKSVGQADKIDVLAYNKANNLIKDTFTYTKDMVVNYINGELRSAIGHYACDNYIEIEPSTDYIFVGINGNRAYYDKNKQVVPPINNSYLQVLLDKTNGSKKNFSVEKSPSNARYIRISIHEDNLVGGKAYLYKSSNYDHKQISTTLRSLPNGVKDTIEKRGNKYVKVQRCGEVVLNGNGNWYRTEVRQNNTIQFAVRKGTDVAYKGDNEIFMYCDKIKAIEEKYWYNDDELIFINNLDFVVSLSKSKLSSQDVEGFKTWLQANPITVVYELATPQIIELPNFNPQTFEGDTTLLINSGVIQANAEFEVTNSMGSEIEVLKDKVSSLDTSVNKDILNVYSMDLFNGVETTGNKIYGVLQYNDRAILSAELNITTELRYGQAIGKLHVTPKRASYPILILKINTGTCVQGWLYPDGTIKTLNSIPAGERICFTAPILL